MIDRRDRCPIFVAAVVAAVCGGAPSSSASAPLPEMKIAQGRLAGESAANARSAVAGPVLDARRIAIFDALYRRVIGRETGGQRSGE